MVHVGVDLHKRSSQLAVLMPDGEVTQQRLENDPTQLERFFAQIPRGARVAIEASGTWWWFVDLVERLGHHAILSNPKQTKAIAAARLKNDRVDAERLALLLRGDLLPTVWIPPAGLREARELVRHRVSLVWVRTEIKNRLLALLSRRNLQPTSSTRWLTVRGRRSRGYPWARFRARFGRTASRCSGSSMSRSAAWITSSSSAGGTIPECSASGPFLESAPSRPSS
jgi:transposase